MKINKIMHFIWLGRGRLLPDRNLLTLFRWLASNPQFEAWLWIENESLVDAYSKKMYRLWQQKGKNIISEKLFAGIILKEPVSDELMDNFIEYELTRFRPNYRAASDLLRYKVLNKYGGAYFDTDIEPGEISLQESGIFTQEIEQHCLYVDRNSQNVGVIGNDAMIATARNPVLKEIYETAIGNYQVKDQIDKNKECEEHNQKDLIHLDTLLQRTYRYDEFLAAPHSGYIEVMTSGRTGAQLLRSVIAPFLEEEVSADFKNIYFLDNLTKPKPVNDRSWLNMPLQRYEDMSEAIDIARRNLLFEIKYMGMFRLDDYFSHIVQSTGHEGAGHELLHRLHNQNDIGIHQEMIKSIQVTYWYTSTIEFYRKYGLLDAPHIKVYIFPQNEVEEYRLAITYSAHYHVLLLLFDSIKNLQGKADDVQFKNLPAWKREEIIFYLHQGVNSLKRNPELVTEKRIPPGYKEVVQQVINLFARFQPIAPENLSTAIEELKGYIITVQQ